MTEGESYKDKAGKNHTGNNSMTDCYGKYTNLRYDNDGFRYPKQVIDFGIVERDTLHPTQKPVALMEYMIRTYTNEGQTVLDNTMGSGTTGVACIKTSRKFIGIEKDSTYFRVAVDRIKQAHVEKAAQCLMRQ